MTYWYGLHGGYHEEMAASLKDLGVRYDRSAPKYDDDHWFWYRVSDEEAKKLPHEDGAPYLPISDGIGGYGLYPEASSGFREERDLKDSFWISF
jgi:hypothetical protein